MLISFWASYDALSRMHNAQLNEVLNHTSRKVEMISVSFDEFSSVCKETIRKDRLNARVCAVETKGEDSGLFKKYRLNRGFANYLLDDNGIIIAKNISAENLLSILN